MKKDYYALLMTILFINYNLILNGLKIGGKIYEIFMITLIIINILFLIRYRNDIKFKRPIIVIYFFTWILLSKDYLQCSFGITNLIILSLIELSKGNLIKNIILVITMLLLIMISLPILFIHLLMIDQTNIYNDSHYFCENNYEIYAYSMGAMDNYHYSIGKHYEFLNNDDIIYMIYSERNEIQQKAYSNYLNTHKCKLVGDINEH